jgi:hypothetical protein
MNIASPIGRQIWMPFLLLLAGLAPTTAAAQPREVVGNRVRGFLSLRESPR